MNMVQGEFQHDVSNDVFLLIISYGESNIYIYIYLLKRDKSAEIKCSICAYMNT